MSLLQEESALLEIVRLVGRDSLSEKDQLKLEITKSLREDFLQQNAFHDIDTFCSLEKQDKMMKAILKFYQEALKALDKGIYLSEIEKMPVRERITRAKNIPEDQLEKLEQLMDKIEEDMEELIKGGRQDA